MDVHVAHVLDVSLQLLQLLLVVDPKVKLLDGLHVFRYHLLVEVRHHQNSLFHGGLEVADHVMAVVHDVFAVSYLEHVVQSWIMLELVGYLVDYSHTDG